MAALWSFLKINILNEFVVAKIGSSFIIFGVIKREKYLLKICLIYVDSFSKIDGFAEPSSQIDGFGRTHANGATAICSHFYPMMILWKTWKRINTAESVSETLF